MVEEKKVTFREALAFTIGINVVLIILLAYLILSDTSIEQQSPSDHIEKEQIRVYEDRIVINVSNVSWSEYTNTNSMDPVLDDGMNGFEASIIDDKDVVVGDIISFIYKKDKYVHRVIRVGYDEEGWYAVTKGDNNWFKDVGKRRLSDVEGVMIGVVY